MNHKSQIRRLAILVPALLAAVVAAGGRAAPRAVTGPAEFETRCGWFSNPTPANVWLYDREGEWTIGVQGGYQVEGDWPWPDFKRQWVRTNVNYGYGCACLQLRVNKETHEVMEIKSARARPLSQCRKDRALNKWRKKL
jgi:hypothetical protein